MRTTIRQATWMALWLAAAAFAATPSTPTAAPTELEAQSRALERASQAVVGVQALALEDARSNATLGRLRQGSGVVIGEDGTVLTIGYLILEAEDVVLTTDDGREVPATGVAYDVATGLGMVRPLLPLKLAPAPLGRSGAVAGNEPLIVVSGGDEGAVSGARMVSRRGFSGNWEYHIDGALFTAPARRDHSGAGLFNGRGELVGIGSLWLADAGSGEGPRQSGNMFVPIDLLTPVLSELRARGSSRPSDRAWIGLQCAETGSGLRIMRGNPDSPAELAGWVAGRRCGRRRAAAGSIRASHLARDAGGKREEWTRPVGRKDELLAGGEPDRNLTLPVLAREHIHPENAVVPVRVTNPRR